MAPRGTLNRLVGPVLVPVLVLALGLLAYDAGSRAALAYRALHGGGRPGTFVVDSCGTRGCVGAFYYAPDTAPGDEVLRMGGLIDVVIEGRHRPGERVPATIADGRVLPRERSVWLYPAIVALVATLGLATVVGYGLARPLLRRRRR